METVWLVELGNIFEDDSDYPLNLTYKIFGDKYFVFSNNGSAVDTIRELLNSKGYKECWIDVSVGKNRHEQVDYLSFVNGENPDYELKNCQSIGVWFKEKEVR